MNKIEPTSGKAEKTAVKQYCFSVEGIEEFSYGSYSRGAGDILNYYITIRYTCPENTAVWYEG